MDGAGSSTLTLTQASENLGCRFRCLLRLPGVELSSEAAGLDVPRSVLSLVRAGAPGQWQVNWTLAGILEEGPTGEGPWTPVAGTQANSYSFTLGTGPRFFRVRGL
jgi:hypothetical protein